MHIIVEETNREPIPDMVRFHELVPCDDHERINQDDVWCDNCDDWGEPHWHKDIQHHPMCGCSRSLFLHRVPTEELKRQRLQLKINIQVLGQMIDEYDYECDALELDASLKAHTLILAELQTRC